MAVAEVVRAADVTDVTGDGSDGDDNEAVRQEILDQRWMRVGKGDTFCKK